METIGGAGWYWLVSTESLWWLSQQQMLASLSVCLLFYFLCFIIVNCCVHALHKHHPGCTIDSSFFSVFLKKKRKKPGTIVGKPAYCAGEEVGLHWKAQRPFQHVPVNCIFFKTYVLTSWCPGRWQWRRQPMWFAQPFQMQSHKDLTARVSRR